MSCVVSTDQIWAQPYVPGLWTGPWDWYPRGFSVGNDVYRTVVSGPSGGVIYSIVTGTRNGIPGYWNTSYGTILTALY